MAFTRPAAKPWPPKVTTNRVVVVDKVLELRSVNGPQFTLIQGYQEPGNLYGPSAIRCAYLARGATLSGFTLTNGTAVNGQSGGGVWCDSTNITVTNCVLIANAGNGARSGTLNNCTLIGNSQEAAEGSVLNNCTISANGRGALYSTLNNCVVSSNYVGGASYCTLNNCTLVGNSAGEGGGAYYCSLTNCTLTGNSASSSGGGAYAGTLDNCRLTGNSAKSGWGGGVASGTLNNCTLTGNSASVGGGTYACRLNNCIVYFNTDDTDAYSANYDDSCIFNYSCTTPQPSGGTGNLSVDPQLASATHLSASSPCLGAGFAGFAKGTDIDGEAWASPPSIGCDEVHVGAATGPVSVAISAPFTTVFPGTTLEFTGLIEGRTTASAWDFGDGLVFSNRPYASHAWSMPGYYAVVLRAYNDSQVSGASATVMVRVVTNQTVHHVSGDSTNPVSPYVSWATAATNIQDAVDAGALGGTILVTNGTYASGGRAANRVFVDRPLTLRSVNGPQFTVINGNNDARCVNMAKGEHLDRLHLDRRSRLRWCRGVQRRGQHISGRSCRFQLCNDG